MGQAISKTTTNCIIMTSLTDLAAIISAESRKLSDYIVKNNLPNPSFDLGAPPDRKSTRLNSSHWE